jgi:hypothetical protein
VLLADQILSAMDPAHYITRLGLSLYIWQQYVVNPAIRRLILNCARQSGKSTITAAIAWHQAKTKPKSLVLIFSPTERQSKELMEKIDEFARMDPELEDLVSDAVQTKRLRNGSRIVALPGKERNIRGFSGPDMIIIDEASRVEEGLYRAVRPMMVSSDTRLITMSTPFGKRGWWYEEWNSNPMWEKVLVTAPIEIDPGMNKPVLTKLSEEEFSAGWKEKGVTAFYSPRHDLQFMTEEWHSMPEWWFRQEYLGEFLDADDAVFRESDIRAAFDAGREIGSPMDEPIMEDSGAEVFDWTRL